MDQTARRRPKHQQGSVYERCGAWFVRYYVTIGDKRVQRSKFLIAKDAKHPTKTCATVKNARDAFMLREVNNGSNRRNHDERIVSFWETKYLPFITENKKPSTRRGYSQIYKQFLKDHFGEMTLSEYRPHHATALLNSIASKQVRNTLNHVRALLSAIFAYAVATGVIDTNPIHDAKLLVKPKQSKPTGFYTLEEAEDIISALVKHVDCQLVMALSCFLGLRPGEIQGLRWEDIDAQAIHIRRSVWQGIVGTPKTPESIASLPLIDAVRIPLELWRRKCGNPSEGWVFETQSGDPIDLRDWTKRRIKPTLEAKNIVWKGIYSGRRGAGTAAIDLTNGNVAAGQELLRHKDMNTTLRFYKKATGVNLAAGLAAMQSKLLKA